MSNNSSNSITKCLIDVLIWTSQIHSLEFVVGYNCALTAMELYEERASGKSVSFFIKPVIHVSNSLSFLVK